MIGKSDSMENYYGPRKATPILTNNTWRKDPFALPASVNSAFSRPRLSNRESKQQVQRTALPPTIDTLESSRQQRQVIFVNSAEAESSKDSLITASRNKTKNIITATGKSMGEKSPFLMSIARNASAEESGRAQSASTTASGKRVRFSPELISYDKCKKSPPSPGSPTTSALKQQQRNSYKVGGTVVVGNSATEAFFWRDSRLPTSLVYAKKKDESSSEGRPAAVPGLYSMRRVASASTVGIRPSLSDQLASITASAEALTLDIRAKAGLDMAERSLESPLLTLPAKNFSVGTLSCRFPSPVFHHPYESSEISMIMYYKDFLQPSALGSRVQFRLPRRLAHFANDFDPSNANHLISIELTSSVALGSLRQRIWPLLRSR